jgi:hypothetical protein
MSLMLRLSQSVQSDKLNEVQDSKTTASQEAEGLSFLELVYTGGCWAYLLVSNLPTVV